MKISILCTDTMHPVMSYLTKWRNEENSRGHEVSIYSDKTELLSGDFLFLISCGQIVEKNITEKFTYSLVIHASDLPAGRGWSPHIWSILNKESVITVSLLEADEKVDAGRIWCKKEIRLDGHELLDEINKLLFETELQLMSYAVDNFTQIKPYQQVGQPSYWPKRKPEDSRLDPNKTIAEQFDLLRVADNTRYPCFFDYLGHSYVVQINKVKND